MSNLLNSWLSKKPDSSRSKEYKSYGYYAFGAVLENFSLYHDISQHAVCLNQLFQLPRILAELLDSSLGKEALTLTETPSKLKEFGEKPIDEIYWAGMLKKYNERLRSHKTTTGISTANWFEELLENSDFVNYISSILQNKKAKEEPQFISNIELKLFTQVLLRVAPYLERRIFSAMVTAPTPFYLLVRQSSVFRLWFILWLYQNKKSLSITANELSKNPTQSIESIGVGGLDTWRVKCVYHLETDSKNIIGIAGPYIQQAEQDTGIKLDEAFHCLFIDKYCIEIGQTKVRLQEKTPFTNALQQRIHHTEDQNHKRLFELRQNWEVLENIEVHLPANQLYLMGFHELTELALAICWLARFQDYPEWGVYYERFSLSLETNEASGIFFYLNRPSEFRYMLECKKEYEVTLHRPMKMMPDRATGRARWVRDLTDIENRMLSRRQIMFRNITEQMSQLLKSFAGINYLSSDHVNQKGSAVVINPDVIRVCDTICSMLCRATGADSAQLFIVNHSESKKNLLSTVGLFSRDPGWFIPKTITQHLNNERSEELEKSLDDRLPKSFVIRSIYIGDAVRVPSLNNINSSLTKDYSRPKPHSGVSVPIWFQNRLLGVLQVKGSKENQFEDNWMSMFTQTADLISPYLYQLRFNNILSNIQQTLAQQDLDLAMAEKPLNQISSLLCDVLLVDHVQLVFRDGTHFSRFVIRGSNSNGLGTIGTISPKSSAKLNPDQENRFSILDLFSGVTSGHTSMYIEKAHRFDYIHIQYDKKSRTLLAARHSPTDIRQHITEKSSVRLRLDDQPEFIKQLLEQQSHVAEIIVFPIAAPPPEPGLELLKAEQGKCRLVGFTMAYNKTYREMGHHWKSIVRSIAQAISVGVDHSEQLFTLKTENERFLRHQVKAYVRAISTGLGSYKDQAHWLKEEISKKVDIQTNELEAIRSVVSELDSMSSKTVLKKSLSKSNQLLDKLERKLEEKQKEVSALRLVNKRTKLSQSTARQKNALWLKSVFQNRNDQLTSELKAILGLEIKAKNLQDKIIPELYHQLEHIKNASFYQRLGVNVAVKKEPLDVIEYLHQQVKLYSTERIKKGLYFDFTGLPAELVVRIHPVVLGHIFSNLLSNIVKYSHKNTLVRFSSPDEDLRRTPITSIVFENRFAAEASGRVNNSKTQQVHNTSSNNDSEGIGLIIVEKLCRDFLLSPPHLQVISSSTTGKVTLSVYRYEIDFSKIIYRGH